MNGIGPGGPEDHEFAVCLTHDVDRIYKTFQGPYFALKRGDFGQLTDYVTGERPFWQFENIMALEDDLGVRSSFYFLNEQRLLRDKHPREWLSPSNWMLFTGRYDVTDGEVADVVRKLDRGGWEVGLHGSYESYADPERLRYEKDTLEGVLGHDVVGGRQHYLNLDRPRTWEYHREIGLQYDTSLGSSSECGFEYGYHHLRPFDDEFVVFPTTIMDVALMESHESIEGAWAECESILERASEHGAVMTVLWHPSKFDERTFPGYRAIYERLVRTAREMNAWVGPASEYYSSLDLDT